MPSGFEARIMQVITFDRDHDPTLTDLVDLIGVRADVPARQPLALVRASPGLGHLAMDLT